MKVLRKIAILCTLLPAQAWAGGDALIEGAKLCTIHLPRYEREYAIPTHLLSAIASTESGRYHDGLKLRLPWPWTINVAGKGYFFETKDEAIAAVRKYRAKGIQSIDVGCMQVNLYHHPDAFTSLDQAFEPQANIAYAANFLHGLYTEGGSWKKAAADYHSKTPKLGNEYVDIVYNSWFTIIDKLRAAKLQVADSALTAIKTIPSTRTFAAATPVAGSKTTLLPEQQGKEVAPHKAPHMDMIQVVNTDNHTVTTGSTKENGVMVIRPQIVTADNTPLPAPSSVAADDPKIVRINVNQGRPIETTRPRKSGPNFIFND